MEADIARTTDIVHRVSCTGASKGTGIISLQQSLSCSSTGLDFVLPRTFKLALLGCPNPFSPGFGPPLRPPISVLESTEFRASLCLVHRREPPLQHLQPNVPAQKPPPHVDGRDGAVVLIPPVDVRADPSGPYVSREPFEGLPRSGLSRFAEMGALGRVDAGDSDGYLRGGSTSTTGRTYALEDAYGVVLQFLPHGHLAAGEPAPARQPAAGRVEQPEPVAVANARDGAEERALAPEGGRDAGRAGDAAQVQRVEPAAGQDGAGHDRRGYDDLGRGVVSPVAGEAGRGPGAGRSAGLAASIAVVVVIGCQRWNP